MPTTAIATWNAGRLDPVMDPDGADAIAVRIAASLVLARGTILGEVTASPGTYAAYASGNSDGTQVAKGILAYDVATDGSGILTYGGAATGGEWGQTELSVPMWISGTFKVSELTGFDATAKTALAAHYTSIDVIRIG